MPFPLVFAITYPIAAKETEAAINAGLNFSRSTKKTTPPASVSNAPPPNKLPALADKSNRLPVLPIDLIWL